MSHCSEGEKGCTPKRSHNAIGSKTVAGKNIGKTDGALPCSGRREESSGKACFPPVLPMRSSYATSMLGHAKKREPNRSPFAVRFRPHQPDPGARRGSKLRVCPTEAVPRPPAHTRKRQPARESHGRPETPASAKLLARPAPAHHSSRQTNPNPAWRSAWAGFERYPCF